MAVRALDELERLGRIKFPADGSFRSARFFTADDGMGFSYNENRVRKGFDLVVWLKHHWEANYIVSGKGEVTDLTRQEKWPLEAGVLYVVGPNDRHRLHLTEDECHISIFHPPLKGNERFDNDGSYEPSGPVPKTDRRMFVKRLDEMRLAGQEIMVAAGQGRSTRMLTQADDVGFGLSDVRLSAGAQANICPANHQQANHIISGSGEITSNATGQTWELIASTAFSAGPGDQLTLRARTNMHLLCITSPPQAAEGQSNEVGADGQSMW